MERQPARESVLIFRTVNVEKMALVLGACQRRWPNAAIVVLSSPNRRAELLADPRVSDVVDAAVGADGFPPRVYLDRRFAAVVVPLGNSGGTGYANALAAARRCRADAHFVMPYATELQRASVMRLWWMTTLEGLVLGLAHPVSRLAAYLLLPRT